ncbi:MAG: DMT family transporter [Gemmatimonadaceae bacterium]|nr:DMT family transporter [Gemmatimonadaceae bacterium]
MLTTNDRGAGRATLLIVLSACGFGSLSTLTLFTTRAGLPLLPAMFWRYFLAAAFLVVVLRGAAYREVTRQQALRLVLVGGFGQGVITYLSLRALDYLPVGPLAFLFYTYPAWVALIAAVTGREEVTLWRLLALVIAMAGIVVMVGAPDAASLAPVGVVIALGTAFLYALYLPALQKVQEGVPAMVSTFYLVTGVLIAFLAGSVFMHELQVPASLTIWKYLVLLSMVSTVLAFATLIAGLRVLGPVRTSIIATIEPFFTVTLGVLLLGESLTRGTLAGGAMIASAVLLLQWTGRESPVADPLR